MLNVTCRRITTLHPIFTWFTRYNKGRSMVPPFASIQHAHILQESQINPTTTYLNNLFWTPRFYQASGLSNEFEQEILKFKNLSVWDDKHVLAMTQIILMEATRDTTFDLSFHFKANPSPICQYHGLIDCLMY
jgi:hypothetical protein